MNINEKLKKPFSNVKKAWRKFRYLDKTQLNYYAVTGFIAAFCLFTGVSYAAFNLTQNALVGNISIAKLSYNLTIDSCGSCTSGDTLDTTYPYVTVPANTTSTVNLTLTSLNNNYSFSTKSFETRYALNYSKSADSIVEYGSSDNVGVYYSTNNTPNMEGIIGSYGAQKSLRVVVKNESETDQVVYFRVDGGYLQNTIRSNITRPYSENDIVIRTSVLDYNFNFKEYVDTFPTNTSSQIYAYYRTVCDDKDVSPLYDIEHNTISLDVDKQTVCDVYFKEMCSVGNGCADIEVAYNITDANGNSRISQTSPGKNYEYKSGYCSGGATIGTPTWNASKNAWELNITNITSTNLCVAYFEEKPIQCVDESGNTIACPETFAMGDRIKIGTEYFRYLRTTDTSDTTNTYNECQDGGDASIECTDADSRHPLADNQLRLLAEYNLNVGSNKNSSVTEGIQHESIRGERADGGTKYGNIAYGPNTYYSQSNVKTYTENYANYLNATYFGGSNEVSGSAITRSELTMLGCPSGTSTGTCASTYPWVYTTTYWSGSPYNADYVWIVKSNTYLSYSYYYFASSFGVRPVISISASSI